MTALPEEKRYTYADLLSWEGDVRYELYDGYPMAMSSPSLDHQTVSGELFLQIGTYLRGKKCRVFYAPFDVRIFEQDGDLPQDVRTVLQPDLLVVCDPKKLDERGVRGAPDLVVEVLSPSTAQNDRGRECGSTGSWTRRPGRRRSTPWRAGLTAPQPPYTERVPPCRWACWRGSRWTCGRCSRNWSGKRNKKERGLSTPLNPLSLC